MDVRFAISAITLEMGASSVVSMVKELSPLGGTTMSWIEVLLLLEAIILMCKNYFFSSPLFFLPSIFIFQQMGFCWVCGRFNVHHPRCKNNPDLAQNPHYQPPPPTTPTTTQAHIDVDDPNDPDEPPLRRQRFVRTCLTVWVSILCSLGLIAIILAIFFASQLQNAFRPSQRQSLQEAATVSGIVGAILLVPGIILAITWCSMACQCCCCKKMWICKCCR